MNSKISFISVMEKSISKGVQIDDDKTSEDDSAMNPSEQLPH